MLRRHVDEGKHAGLISLVARHGRIVDWQVYGSRDLGAKLPMEKDTIVRVYSMSKVISSVAVMILHEEGRLKLDDPVGKYLPALAKMKVFTGGSAKKPKLVDATRQMTVKDLLTHSSGLIYGFGKEPLDEIYRDAKILESPSMDAFVAKLATLPLAHQPGDRFSYGLSIDVLGAIVEKVAGVPFERFVAERITTPLGMVDTGYDVPGQARRGWPRSIRSTRPTPWSNCPRRSWPASTPSRGAGSRPAAPACSPRSATTRGSGRCCSTAANSTACGSWGARRWS